MSGQENMGIVEMWPLVVEVRLKYLQAAPVV